MDDGVKVRLRDDGRWYDDLIIERSGAIRMQGGDGSYDYALSVPARERRRLADELLRATSPAGKRNDADVNDTGLVGLIQAVFAAEPRLSSGFRNWLQSKGIEHSFFNWF